MKKNQKNDTTDSGGLEAFRLVVKMTTDQDPTTWSTNDSSGITRGKHPRLHSQITNGIQFINKNMNTKKNKSILTGGVSESPVRRS